jgi:4-aminobutyrate aminotransferase-like enzyme
MWACEHENVIPDMIAVSKGLASGLPISAVIAADEVAASWGPGAHVATFTATPLAAAAANATLDLYQSEQLIRRAADLGEYFRQQLDQLQERHPILGWIDARGLFIGLEFVRDRATKEPAADEAAWMLDYCVREGLLFEKGGYYYNRFQLIPPLVVEKDGIDRAITILDQAMTMAETRSGITRT